MIPPGVIEEAASFNVSACDDGQRQSSARRDNTMMQLVAKGKECNG